MPGSKFTTGMGRSLWLNTLMSLTSSSLTPPTPLVEMVVVKCVYGRDGGCACVYVVYCRHELGVCVQNVLLRLSVCVCFSGFICCVYKFIGDL